MAQATYDAGLTTENTVAAMLKLQQTGGVISKEVLPHFAKRMQQAAQNNGGLESALNSNRVAMNRLTMSLQEGADTFFKTGFAEGLTDFFNTSAETLRDLNPLFKALGRILGSVFHVISRGIELVTPPLRLLSMLLDGITEATGKLSFVLTSVFGVGIAGLLAKTGTFTKFIAKMRLGFLAMLAPVWKVVGALMLLEELLNKLVFKDKVGVMYDPRNDPDSEHYDKNKTLQKQKEALLNIPAFERFISDGIGEGTSFTADNIMNLFKMFNTRAPTSVSEHLSGSMRSNSNPQPITVQGNVCIDGEQAGKVLGDTSSMKQAIGAVIYPSLTN